MLMKLEGELILILMILVKKNYVYMENFLDFGLRFI